MRRRILRRLLSLGRAFLKLGGLMLALTLVQLLVFSTLVLHRNREPVMGEAQASKLVAKGLDAWGERERVRGEVSWTDGYHVVCHHQDATFWFDCRMLYTNHQDGYAPEQYAHAGRYYCDEHACIVDARLIS